jgi:hypothetical protein
VTAIMLRLFRCHGKGGRRSALWFWPQEPDGARRGRWPICRQSTRQGAIMDFRIKGLPAETFDSLFTLSNAQLKTRGAIRRITDRVVSCRIERA